MPDEDTSQPEQPAEQTEYERFEELARKAFHTPKTKNLADRVKESEGQGYGEPKEPSENRGS